MKKMVYYGRSKTTKKLTRQEVLKKEKGSEMYGNN